MSILIKQLNIHSFRGIRQLEINSMNHVNIIAGDNNCGKTSMLEAIMLIRNPSDITNVLRIARIRDARGGVGASSTFESFINLFPGGAQNLEICFDAVCNDDSLHYRLIGEQKRIMLEQSDVLVRRPYGYKQYTSPEYDPIPVETDAFVGEMQCEYGDVKKNVRIDIDAYTSRR
ncbi:MAG: AAA family ATPase, partial [Kiritimatiellaeota bacterium]|nr:AAA family ATPase [Kiritimatiellota bacterium]